MADKSISNPTTIFMGGTTLTQVDMLLAENGNDFLTDFSFLAEHLDHQDAATLFYIVNAYEVVNTFLGDDVFVELVNRANDAVREAPKNEESLFDLPSQPRDKGFAWDIRFDSERNLWVIQPPEWLKDTPDDDVDV